MTLAILSIKWQHLISEKGKAPLTAQQIARAERADRRRADKEKLQQVIIVSTNPTFNLTPLPGPIRVDEGIISPKLVKHPNSPENFQGQWNLEILDRGFADIRKKKRTVKRLIFEKLKLFLTFSPRFKRYSKSVRSEPNTPRGSSSTSHRTNKDSGEIEPKSLDEFGYTSDTPLIQTTKSLLSETEDTYQKVVYQTPSQVLDIAIQIVSFESQGSFQRDFNSIPANLFPDFNQIGSEFIAVNKNLFVQFEATSGKALITTWDMDNTTSLEDVVGSSQASLL